VRRWPALVVLGLVLVAGAFAVRRAWTHLRSFRRSSETCDAVEARDWRRALRASEGRLTASVDDLATADCRCMALMANKRRGECVALLERELADPAAGDWLPRPPLTAELVAARRDRGALPAALQLAIRGNDRYHESAPLLIHEATLRLQLQPPATAFEAMDRRVAAAGAQAAFLRTFLAVQAFQRGDFERTLKLLPDAPPPQPTASTGADWWDIRAITLAHLGRPQALLNHVDAWARVKPERAKAAYAYLLSTSQMSDPRGRYRIALLRDAVESGDRVGDPELLRRVWIRYVGELVISGRHDEALRAFDAGVAKLGNLGHLVREDLARTGAEAEPAAAPGAAGTGVELQARGAGPGWRLLVSPPAAAPHDAPYEAVELPPSRRVHLARAVEAWPLRWVLRDAQDRVRGSGAAWPGGSGAAPVPIVARQTTAAAVSTAAALPPQRPASGRRRLFVVILDCGDWRFVQHGRARRELPTFDALIAGGTSAVLTSEPAFTAMAMRSITKPGARGVDSVLASLYQLGDELGGLNFVGRNPLGPLGWVLPGAVDLFAALGAGDLRVANLLHSEGGLKLGRHGAVVGPHGVESGIPLAPTRPLRADEGALLGELDKVKSKLLAEMAADFDNASQLAGPGGPDLVMLRVASLDLVTHATFPAVAAAGQDDGKPLLFRVYRYVDGRLGEIYRRLDGNDVLIVMSDHGIRTALQHDPQAFFVAVGAGVPVQRLPGAPELRGLPRAIADFFGVETAWPATGVESWVAAARGPATAASHAGAP